jgi:tRNA(Arg) A34 adenosine deaminase TadA
VSFSAWDRQCMTLALEEARRAADRGEVPVGAVLTRGESILAHGGNACCEKPVSDTATIDFRELPCMSASNLARCAAARWFMPVSLP